MSVPQEHRSGRPGGSPAPAKRASHPAAPAPSAGSAHPEESPGPAYPAGPAQPLGSAHPEESAGSARPAGSAQPEGPVPLVGSAGLPGSAPTAWRGKRLGLPASGAGSVAGTGPRLGAFVVDVALSALVAGLFTAPELPRNWSLVAFLAEYVVFGAAFGQTPGMRLFGLRLARVDRPGRVGIVRVVARTALLALLVPALIWDADGRCLHERYTQTVLIRT